ncbi:ninja-family protein AFP3-like [Phalaenopsis equestris]|uniref:ninja-family protein AFP3-like n=1 Tax=Phalaenopsis equestris TaxID=78828 RepID=UPI0009E54DC6|nr:ninja-family protein AFP3-like [Phalaenopsis equestris]
MSADSPSSAAGEFTLRPPPFSRISPEAMIKKKRNTKPISGNRRRFLSPAAAIPVMPMQCSHYVPCMGSPYALHYVVPRWGTPVVCPAVVATFVGDEKSDSPELLQSSAKANAPESSSSITGDKSKTPDLHESSSNNGKKTMKPIIPYVTAKGDGLQGKTTGGFLYRYTKVDELRIMCVCHGLSFSPAEFLRHAGNSHTSEPLRHIIVMLSPARR